MIGHGIMKALANKRTCSYCKKHQVVPPERKRDTVTCKACGRPIPPPRKH